ncbi:MAG: nucleoside deaminase [Halobacteriaceae archaeon]
MGADEEPTPTGLSDATDEAYIERAIELARAAAGRGDEPFGSLLVHDGAVVAEAKNAVNTSDDVRAHPELRLARTAARELGDDAADATLYTSTEPCPMCAGGLYHAGLGRVVYSVSGAMLEELLGPGLFIPCAEIFAEGPRRVTVEGPVLPEAGQAVHEEFWFD